MWFWWLSDLIVILKPKSLKWVWYIVSLCVFFNISKYFTNIYNGWTNIKAIKKILHDTSGKPMGHEEGENMLVTYIPIVTHSPPNQSI
jgi:hypothetical protein